MQASSTRYTGRQGGGSLSSFQSCVTDRSSSGRGSGGRVSCGWRVSSRRRAVASATPKGGLSRAGACWPSASSRCLRPTAPPLLRWSERRPTLSEVVRDCTGRRLAPPLLERVCGRAAGAASPRDGQLRHRQVVDAARRRGAAGQAAENGASFTGPPRCTGAPSRGCGTAVRATSLARTPPTRCSCRSGRTARSARCGSSWCTRGLSTSGEL